MFLIASEILLVIDVKEAQDLTFSICKELSKDIKNEFYDRINIFVKKESTEDQAYIECLMNDEFSYFSLMTYPKRYFLRIWNGDQYSEIRINEKLFYDLINYSITYYKGASLG
jgi:hypothetical protein